MSKHLCIHGHFYQPPRENPWLDDILPEGSAAPMDNWNERILAESYGPLAFARRLNGEGRITELVNCYEWMSFNFGPTLLRWMQRLTPDVYARILEGDRNSLKRWGHGNALAQVQHHVIMPLANDRDKRLETGWALSDFRARFGRDAEGFWLSETAVDEATLEVLAEAGVQFTILAPRQAQAVKPLDADEWTAVHEHSLDMSRPYLCRLPSGRQMAIFFYHGDLSQAVAFERLLEDGEHFWNRLSSTAATLNNPGRDSLLSIATDGETYGHHFSFGEMALAYVLAQTFFQRDEITLTNYGRFLADNPPDMEVRLHCPSSWSCVHGVERWRSDCGCTTGGPAEWNQQWRAPLRAGLERVKEHLDSHFLDLGATLFTDPEHALMDYGQVMTGSMLPGDYERHHFLPTLSQEQRSTAWSLLDMEQWGLASFASCAWFFEELSRIEPLGALTFALRAMDICRATGGTDPEPALLRELEQARSNIPSKGSGKDLYEQEVLPRRLDASTLCALGLLLCHASGSLPVPGGTAELLWPAVRLVMHVQSGETEHPTGTVDIFTTHDPTPKHLTWKWRLSRARDILDSQFTITDAQGEERTVLAADLPLNGRQAIARERIIYSEEKAWDLSGSLMFTAAPLFPAYQEGQRVQTMDDQWTMFWPALAMAYVHGLNMDRGGSTDRPDLLCSSQQECLSLFLLERSSGNPARPLLERKIGQECLKLLNQTPPSLTLLEGMLSRAREIGLDRVCPELQNRLWELRDTELPGEERFRLEAVMRLAGFA